VELSFPQNEIKTNDNSILTTPIHITMTYSYKDDPKKEEPDIVIDNAVPASGPAGPPVLPGHHRFYCEKCRTVSTPQPTWDNEEPVQF